MPKQSHDTAGRIGNSAPLLKCTSRTGHATTWISVAGELDLSVSGELERHLRLGLSRSHLVVLDVRDLSFIDAAGIHTIVESGIAARRDRRRLVLVQAPPWLDRLFTLTDTSGAVERLDLDEESGDPRGARQVVRPSSGRAALMWRSASPRWAAPGGG